MFSYPQADRVKHFVVRFSKWRSQLVFINNLDQDHLVQRSGLSGEAAATILLKAAWENNRDGEMIDHYHWINGTGLIEVGTASEIARLVWEAEA